jgi:hypothetical protein
MTGNMTGNTPAVTADGLTQQQVAVWPRIFVDVGGLE